MTVCQNEMAFLPYATRRIGSVLDLDLVICSSAGEQVCWVTRRLQLLSQRFGPRHSHF